MLIEEATRDRRDAVADMVSGHAWEQYAERALHLHCRNIERALIIDTNRPLEEMRSMQAQWAILQRIIEDPVAFLGYNGEDE